MTGAQTSGNPLFNSAETSAHGSSPWVFETPRCGAGVSKKRGCPFSQDFLAFRSPEKGKSRTKFNDDLSKIKLKVIARHQASEDERALHGISWTEFWWYNQGGRRTFEAEEVVNIPSGGISTTKFGCRFVHSILGEDDKTPIHLDGAIRLYDEEAMIRRLDCDILEAGRKAEYQKLWRIDGALPVESWKELLCHYFRDNHLVGKYLGAERPPEEEKASVFTPSSDPLEPFVPYNLRCGDGVQVHVTFHEKSSGEPGRSVRVVDVLVGDEELPFVDARTTDLGKILQRRGESLLIVPGVNRIKFGDMVLNLPLIGHVGPDAVLLAEHTVAAIAELCECLATRSEDRLVSFTLAMEYADREVWFSSPAIWWISAPGLRLVHRIFRMSSKRLCFGSKRCTHS